MKFGFTFSCTNDLYARSATSMVTGLVLVLHKKKLSEKERLRHEGFFRFLMRVSYQKGCF